MKKYLFLVIPLLLIACEPTPSNVDKAPKKSTSTQALQLTPGLENCELFSHDLTNDGRRYIWIVRCPNKETTSTTREYYENKQRKSATSLVIEDGTKQESKENNELDIVINGKQYRKIDTTKILTINDESYIEL